MGLLGDSNTGRNNYPAFGVTRETDFGYLNYANLFAGQPFDLTVNGGVGGDRTDQIIARLSAYLANDIATSFVLAGTNDVFQDIALATITANLATIYQAHIAARIRPELVAVPPMGVGNAFFSAPRVQKILDVNAFISSYAAAHGLRYHDIHTPMLDGGQVDGRALAAYLPDNTHTGPAGARVAGQVIATNLSGLVTPISLISSQSEVDATQLFSNPLLTTVTGGSNNTSGTITGTMPSGLTLSKAGTWGAGMGSVAMEDRADGFGKNLVLTVTDTGAASDRLFLVSSDVSASIAAGESLRLECDIAFSGLANLFGYDIGVQTTVGGTTYFANCFERDVTTNNYALTYYSNADFGGKIRTPKLIIPGGGESATRMIIIPRFSAADGTMVMKIGRIRLRREVA